MFQATPLNDCSRPRSCVARININKYNMCLRQSSLFLCVVFYRGKRKCSKIPKRSPEGKGQTTIYKTLHRKLKIEQHEPH